MRFRTLHLLALAVLLAALAPTGSAQTDGYLHVNDEMHTFLERQQALGNLQRAFLDEQPLSARRAQRYLDSLAVIAVERPEAFTSTDLRLLDQHRGVMARAGATAINRRVSPLYRNGQDFFSVEEGAFRLQVNPRLYLSGGTAVESDLPGEDRRAFLYRNTRAVRVSGGLGPNFFFHAQVEETQRVEPMVARERTRPRLPLAYQRDPAVFDYPISEAALGYQDRYIEVRLARDRQRWGFARNAMYYSPHAPPHTSLQARVEAWRISFTGHWAVLDDQAVPPPSQYHFNPIKYGVFHRLGLSLPGRVSLGFFEGVIFAPFEEDARFGNYLRFLNPLLFLNAVERESNSPGNVLIGMDAHWVALPGVAAYTQFILDDFEAGELFSNRGYWKNTWGALGGLHLVDVGLPGLELRAEASNIRPYVYANLTGSLAHTHRLGFLGSPAGPNSQTFSLDASYRPLPRLQAGLSGFVLRRGRSPDGRNYGEDPFIPYDFDRVSDNEVFTLQGVRQTRHFGEARLGYEILPAMWIDGVLQAERFEDALDGSGRATSFLLQLRWGMPAGHPLF